MKNKISRIPSILLTLIFLFQQIGQAENLCLRQLAFNERKNSQEKYSTNNAKGENVIYIVDIPSPSHFPGKRQVLFLFHGLSGYKTEPQLQAFAEKFVNEGYVVIRPDFTNNKVGNKPNESAGVLKDFSLETELDDARAVLLDVQNRLSGKIDLSQTTIGGHSYGGLIARRIAAMACSDAQSPFAILGIQAVIDMSGVAYPQGTVRKVLEFQKTQGKISSEVEQAYQDWKSTDAFGPFAGQRFYIWGWEDYTATDDLAKIPKNIPYVYIIGTQDDGIRCLGIPQQAQVNEFLSTVSARPSGILLQNYNMGHAYPAELLPQIVGDVCGKLQLERILNSPILCANDAVERVHIAFQNGEIEPDKYIGFLTRQTIFENQLAVIYGDAFNAALKSVVGMDGLDQAVRYYDLIAGQVAMLPERHGAVEVLAAQPWTFTEVTNKVLGNLITGNIGDPHPVSVPVNLLPKTFQNLFGEAMVDTLSGEHIGAFDYIRDNVDEVIFVPYMLSLQDGGGIERLGGAVFHDKYMPMQPELLTSSKDRPGKRVIYIAASSLLTVRGQKITRVEQLSSVRVHPHNEMDIFKPIIEETAHMETTKMVIDGRLPFKYYDRPYYIWYEKIGNTAVLRALDNFRSVLKRRYRKADPKQIDLFVDSHRQDAITRIRNCNRMLGLPENDFTYQYLNRQVPVATARGAVTATVAENLIQNALRGIDRTMGNTVNRDTARRTLIQLRMGLIGIRWAREALLSLDIDSGLVEAYIREATSPLAISLGPAQAFVEDPYKQLYALLEKASSHLAEEAI